MIWNYEYRLNYTSSQSLHHGRDNPFLL